MGTRGGRTLLGNIVWAPYSVAAWVGSCAWLGVLAGTSAIATIVKPFEKFQTTWPQPQVAWPLIPMFTRLKVDYDPDYDKSRVAVFAQNHVSALDAHIGCGSIPMPICGLEAASHLKIPGYGWLMRVANAIPVEKGANRFEKIADALKERASRGISILAFPEAHRTTDGTVRPLKRGVFHMAVAAGIPIVPVCVRGAYRLLPKGEFTIRPTTVHVYMAPAIETAGLSDAQIPVLMERVHEVMRAWVEDGVKKPELCLEPIPEVPERAAAE
jgi:1-acyl-sn-glycerol-3-phosphate acyltransferase